MKDKKIRKRKFDIFKTFDIFNAEAVSVIKERIIKFVLVEAENFFITKSGTYVNTEIGADDTVHISVINNRKVYNLLTNTWKKHKQREEYENNKCGISNQCGLPENLSRAESA